MFEDDARLLARRSEWNQYRRWFPGDDDCDLILLSDSAWSSTPYQQSRRYNWYYHYLPLPYCDTSGTHAYIVNTRILGLLKSNLTLRLPADDYLNWTINTFRIRVLLTRDVLFTQRPESHR